MVFSTKAVQFDGVNEYVTMGDVLGTTVDRYTACSFSWWMKTTSTTDMTVIARRDDGTPSGWYIYVSGTYIALGLIHTWATNLIWAWTTTSVTDGEWHHCAITYDGSGSGAGVKIYVDGTPVPMTVEYNNLTASIYKAGVNLTIGRRDVSGSYLYYAGFLDEVAIYNKELSALEVTTIWNSGEPNDLSLLGSSSNLVGWWRMGEGSTFPILQDSSGTGPHFPVIQDQGPSVYNGTAVNMELADVQDVSPDSQALVFDGVNEYVDCGNVLGFERTDSFSVNFWFKTSSSGDMHIFNKLNPSIVGWAAIISSGNLYFVLFRDGSNGAGKRTSANYADGGWHHFVATYDGSSLASGISLYVDGVSQATVDVFDTLGTTSIVNTQPVKMACWGSGLSWYTGMLADVSVWNKKLSAVEVTEIYNDRIPINLTGVSCAVNLAAWWRCGDAFSLGSNGVRDFSGNGLHGTATNMEITDVGSRISTSKSLLFDGVDEHITMGDVLGTLFDRYVAFSVSWWMRTTITVAGTVIARQNESSLPSGWVIYTNGTEIGMGLVHTWDSNMLWSYCNGLVLNNASWHHCVATYDGSGNASGMLFYVDGLSVTRTVYMSNLNTSVYKAGVPLTVARRDIPSSYQPYAGSFCEISVWDKNLSASEVEAIYNAGIPENLTGSLNLVGYWSLDVDYYDGTMTNMEAEDIISLTGIKGAYFPLPASKGTLFKGIKGDYKFYPYPSGPEVTYRMRGWRPGTADFEFWESTGSPNTSNPSGLPIQDITVVAEWTS